MKYIKYLVISITICLITGCASTYKIDKASFNEIDIYLNEEGKRYINYVENDKELTNRDKSTIKTKYLNILDIIKQVKTK